MCIEMVPYTYHGDAEVGGADKGQINVVQELIGSWPGGHGFVDRYPSHPPPQYRTGVTDRSRLIGSLRERNIKFVYSATVEG
jgi:hypothetical protein